MSNMNIRKIALFLTLMLIPVVFVLAQGPGGPGSGPNGNGNPSGNGGIPVGEGAPIGSGVVLTILYTGVYCIKKVYSIRKKRK